MSTNTEFDFGVTKEFIEESNAIFKNRSAKRGGPYSKKDREARRNEVFRLHFEYGYSAVKIAEMMKINRNTINGDIQYWYSKVVKKWEFDPSYSIIRHIERLELQKTRLREELDKSQSLQEKMSVERLILDVESRILQTHLKLTEAIRLNHDSAVKWLNDWMKKNKRQDRYLTYLDLVAVSPKSHEKIRKIIKDDKGRARGY